MKKILLLMCACTIGMSMFAQKTWVVGNDPTNFPVSTGIGTDPAYVIIDGLGIYNNTTNVNMGQVEASSKTYDGVAYPNRFKLNGAGYVGAAAGQTEPIVASDTFYMPTQRYLAIAVSGSGEISIVGMTGSNSSERILFVTDGTQLIGSMIFPSGSGTDNIVERTVAYSGNATTLYVFGNSSVNLYRIIATSGVNYTVTPDPDPDPDPDPSSISSVLADNGVFFTGKEITNAQNLKLHVYSVTGKLVATSNASLDIEGFASGVYVVRVEGVPGALKFTK